MREFILFASLYVLTMHSYMFSLVEINDGAICLKQNWLQTLMLLVQQQQQHKTKLYLDCEINKKAKCVSTNGGLIGKRSFRSKIIII